MVLVVVLEGARRKCLTQLQYFTTLRVRRNNVYVCVSKRANGRLYSTMLETCILHVYAFVSKRANGCIQVVSKNANGMYMYASVNVQMVVFNNVRNVHTACICIRQ